MDHQLAEDLMLPPSPMLQEKQTQLKQSAHLCAISNKLRCEGVEINLKYNIRKDNENLLTERINFAICKRENPAFSRAQRQQQRGAETEAAFSRHLGAAGSDMSSSQLYRCVDALCVSVEEIRGQHFALMTECECLLESSH